MTTHRLAISPCFHLLSPPSSSSSSSKVRRDGGSALINSESSSGSVRCSSSSLARFHATGSRLDLDDDVREAERRTSDAPCVRLGLIDPHRVSSSSSSAWAALAATLPVAAVRSTYMDSSSALMTLPFMCLCLTAVASRTAARVSHHTYRKCYPPLPDRDRGSRPMRRYNVTSRRSYRNNTDATSFECQLPPL